MQQFFFVVVVRVAAVAGGPVVGDRWVAEGPSCSGLGDALDSH